MYPNFSFDFSFSCKAKIYVDDGAQNTANKSVEKSEMNSINRIAEYPVMKAASDAYGTVKDYSLISNGALTIAETTLQKAITFKVPIFSLLSKQKVDEMACSALNYVEEKIPAVKLPAGEVYINTKDYLSNNIPGAVNSVKGIVQPAGSAITEIAGSGINYLSNNVSGAANSVKVMTGSGLNYFSNNITGAVNSVKETAQPAGSLISGIAGSGVNYLSNNVSSAANSVKGMAGSGLNYFSNNVTDAVNSVKETVQPAGSSITGIARSGYQKTYDLFYSRK